MTPTTTRATHAACWTITGTWTVRSRFAAWPYIRSPTTSGETMSAARRMSPRMAPRITVTAAATATATTTSGRTSAMLASPRFWDHRKRTGYPANRRGCHAIRGIDQVREDADVAGCAVTWCGHPSGAAGRCPPARADDTAGVRSRRRAAVPARSRRLATRLDLLSGAPIVEEVWTTSRIAGT